MLEFPKKLSQKIENRTKSNSFRELGVSKGLVDFSSNDYLGFARNETLFSKTFKSLLSNNVSQNGATGSRLLTGNHSLFKDLEDLLATFHKAESALVFNSGYDANVGFFGCVPQRGDLVFFDEFIHASIRDGLAMGHAKSYKFLHNSISDLKERIKGVLKSMDHDVHREIYVVSEAVFSMDGDSPDLTALVQLCKNEGYRLVVDEAHAVGVFGNHGEGLIQELGLEQDIFARIITFGKALGNHGAAVLGSHALREYLVNYARSFIYTTALPPYNVVSICSSYAFLHNNGKEERNLLMENITCFKEQVARHGLEKRFVASHSAIQAMIFPSNDKAKEVSRKLADDGFDVKAILSPTVPEGKERLRFCIHSFNSKEEIGLALQLLSKYI